MGFYIISGLILFGMWIISVHISESNNNLKIINKNLMKVIPEREIDVLLLENRLDRILNELTDIRKDSLSDLIEATNNCEYKIKKLHDTQVTISGYVYDMYMKVGNFENREEDRHYLDTD